MNKKDILNEFKKLNIKGSFDLYDFIVANDCVQVGDIFFDLNTSKGSTEFMSLFMQVIGYDYVRFLFKKEDFNHWFLAFFNGDDWFYYEPFLEKLSGQFVFANYDELLFFVTRRLNDYCGGDKNNYILKDFSSNESLSNGGTEVFVNDYMTLDKDYDPKPMVQSSFVREAEQYKNFLFFIIGFFLMIAILILVFWLSSGF